MYQTFGGKWRGTLICPRTRGGTYEEQPSRRSSVLAVWSGVQLKKCPKVYDDQRRAKYNLGPHDSGTASSIDGDTAIHLPL
jgi:hypothetical protein